MPVPEGQWLSVWLYNRMFLVRIRPWEPCVGCRQSKCDWVWKKICIPWQLESSRKSAHCGVVQGSRVWGTFLLSLGVSKSHLWCSQRALDQVYLFLITLVHESFFCVFKQEDPSYPSQRLSSSCLHCGPMSWPFIFHAVTLKASIFIVSKRNPTRMATTQNKSRYGLRAPVPPSRPTPRLVATCLSLFQF